MSLSRVAVLTLWPKTSQPSNPLPAQFPWTLNSPPTLPNLHQPLKLSFLQSWQRWGHRAWGSGPLEVPSQAGQQASGWGQVWRDHRGWELSLGCLPTNCAYSCSRGFKAHSRWEHRGGGFSFGVEEVAACSAITTHFEDYCKGPNVFNIGWVFFDIIKSYIYERFKFMICKNKLGHPLRLFTHKCARKNSWIMLGYSLKTKMSRIFEEKGRIAEI